MNDYEIIGASKLSSSTVWAHFAYNTSHNTRNLTVYNIRDHFERNDGTVRVKNHTEYEVAYGSKRSTS